MANVDFIDDDLDGFFADFGRDSAPRSAPMTVEQMNAIAPIVPQLHREKCVACGGTGSFRSYSGRVVGQCFKCKGAGFKEFKLDASKRAAGRKYAEKAKAVKQAETADVKASWISENEIEYSWLIKNAGSFDFASSLMDTLNRYGRLTEGQLNAVRRIIAKNTVRDEQKAAEAATRTQNAPAVNVQPMIEAFASAREKGIKRPKIRIQGFKFSLAPAHGVNAGAIYVVADEIYLGKIANGRFIRSRDCNEVTEAMIVEICNDPKGAAIAHGRRTGSCACCGRELTNHASIDLGIGPICAEKYGW